MATKTVKPELETEIEGLGGVYYADEPFDIARQLFNSKSIKLITPRDLAYARQQVSKNHSLNVNGSYTGAGFAYAKDEPVLLALNSPLSRNMRLAKQATEANSDGRYFSTSLEVYEKLAQQAEQEQKEGREPEKTNVLILPSRDSFYISRDENWEVMQGVFKDQAGSYFDFNKRDKIMIYLIDKSIDSQYGTTLTQLWLCELSDDFDLNGSRLFGHWGLDCSSMVRGLLKKTGEASRVREKTSVPVKLPYTNEELRRSYELVIRAMNGDLGTRELKEVKGLLKRLMKK